jgi:hypothetical protein
MATVDTTVFHGRGARFWAIFAVINLVYFLALIEAVCPLFILLPPRLNVALIPDKTSVSTALPTIIEAIQGGDQFIWVGAIYNIASTALMPMYGGMAQVRSCHLS